MRTWRQAGVPVARSVLWFVAILVAWTVLPRLFGLEAYTITSGSMEPSLSRGDVVMVGPADPDELEPGQIVAVDRSTGDGADDATLVTHRVIEVDDATIRTRGDANPAADAAVPSDAVVGRARLVVPMVGLPGTWANERQWGALAAWGAAMAIAAAVGLGRRAAQGPPPRPGRPGARRVLARRARRRRRALVGTGAAAVVAVSAGLVGTDVPMLAAFQAATTATATVDAATPLHPPYAGAVAALGPVGHWRLGDPAPDPVLLADDFESFTGWAQERNGTVQAASSPARTGTGSLQKTARNDPNGGTKPMTRSVGNDWQLSTWVYRPGPWSGGAQDRISVEDASGNGYGVRSIHGGNERLQIERRTNDAGSSLASVPFVAPENQWYRLVLVRDGNSLTASAFDGAGTLLGTVSASDGAHDDFDTVAVRGGWDYYLDDLEVTTTVSPTFADATGAPAATGSGSLATSLPGLLTGDPDDAVGLAGAGRIDVPSRPPLDGPTSARTVNAWIEPGVATGRGVIWIEGDASNGISLYRDGPTLRGRAWSTVWPGALDVSAPLPGGASMVTLTLDTASGTAELYLDGALADAVTGGPRPALPAHPAATAIGAQPGPTSYHDGVSSGPGAWFDGVIDEVSAHPTAIDAASVAGLFGAGS